MRIFGDLGSIWLWTRIAALVVALIGGPLFYNDMAAEFEGEIPTFGFVAALLAFCVVGLVFIVGIQTVNPRAQFPWSKPSWRCNPFDFHNPVQTFHLNAWFFLALGISTAVYTLILGSRNFAFVLPLTLGVGLLLGVKVVVIAFRSKFEGENAA